MRPVTAWMAVACLYLVAPPCGGAQEITVGVKGGLNSSSLSVSSQEDPDLGFESQTDFRIGAFVQFALGSKLAIQPEVHYSREGARSRGTEPAVTLNLDYFEIPLLIMARLSSRESPMYPILYAGPSVAFETRCGVSGEQGGASVSFDCDDPEFDGALQTKSTDFRLVFGGGFEILLNRLTIQLDARYRLGLTNLNAAEDATDVSVKSAGWSFMLGLGVPIG